MPVGDNNKGQGNLQPGTPGIPVWNCDDINGSLQAILIYVEEQAKSSIGWY